MNNKQIANFGALGFAAFAVTQYMKSKGKTIGTVTGDQQRLQGSSDMLSQNAAQFTALNKAVQNLKDTMSQAFGNEDIGTGYDVSGQRAGVRYDSAGNVIGVY